MQTTGLDPANKRVVWELVEQLKEGRVVLLSTHSMEEADRLADSVALVAEGTVR
jgi:ABC-type multidrug transport system ATPase subunit